MCFPQLYKGTGSVILVEAFELDVNTLEAMLCLNFELGKCLNYIVTQKHTKSCTYHIDSNKRRPRLSAALEYVPHLGQKC